MTARHERRPDLSECILEDRCLLAFPPGLGPPQFLPEASNNTIIVAGMSLGSPTGGGGASVPGQNFFYLFVGVSSGGGAALAPGASISIYGLGANSASSSVAFGANVGSGANTPGGGGSASSGLSSFAATGGAFSSGYNTSLNISNNYGMSANPVGSIPVHTYDNGTVAESQNPQATDGNNTNTPQQAPMSPAGQGADTGNGSDMNNPMSGPTNNLLRRRPRNTVPPPTISPAPADPTGMGNPTP
jgi:hypothetical protein